MRCTQVEGLGVAGQDDRLRRVRHEEPFVFLGQRGQRDVVQPQFQHHLQGRGELPLAAVNQHQVWDGGPAVLRGALGSIIFRDSSVHGCMAVPRGLAGGGQALETSAQHLAHTVEVVHAPPPSLS